MTAFFFFFVLVEYDCLEVGVVEASRSNHSTRPLAILVEGEFRSLWSSLDTLEMQMVWRTICPSLDWWVISEEIGYLVCLVSYSIIL